VIIPKAAGADCYARIALAGTKESPGETIILKVESLNRTAEWVL
jgi:hypothetical protein